MINLNGHQSNSLRMKHHWGTQNDPLPHTRQLVVSPRFLATVISNEHSARMIPLKLSPELWRFALLVSILIFYQPAYKLVGRIMDRITSTSSKTTSSTELKSPHAGTQSTSPRMPSFPRRFRSSTQNPTSHGVAGTDSIDSPPPTKNEAARSAKRFLVSTIRDDWEFPSSDPQQAQDPLHRKPLDYRIREDGSSDPEPLSDERYDARDPMVFTDSDPYKFESPDAVARTMVERRCKRRRLLKEELGWNEGLRKWVDRRNAWCGAVGQRPRRRRDKIDDPQQNGHDVSVPTELPAPRSPPSPNSASSSSPVDSVPESEDDGELEKPANSPEPLLPVYPSLLPEDNIIRASIKPEMYPAIYSKVVLQSLTPTVPVPLPDVTGALVQGWKSEGNWPPKGAAPATSIIQEGGRRASELLKFRRRESVVAEKGRMRKGVGAVKKALGLRTSSGETNGMGLNPEHEQSKRSSGIDQFGLVEESPPGPS
jgi:Protein of unknown function (DUF4050)